MTFRPLHDRVVVRLVEDEEKKDRVPDAMHATKAAAEEGVVPGGGTALLHAKAAVAKLKTDNPDMQTGIKIVQRALEASIRQIAENAGVEGAIVVGKISDNGPQPSGLMRRLRSTAISSKPAPSIRRRSLSCRTPIPWPASCSPPRTWWPSCRRRSQLRPCPAAAWPARTSRYSEGNSSEADVLATERVGASRGNAPSKGDTSWHAIP
jgi:co-chaperonin GroES (HSP10)